MADWTPLAVVSRSSTTAEIETFINEVSTTSTNMAIDSSTMSRRLPCSTGTVPLSADSLIRFPPGVTGTCAPPLRAVTLVTQALSDEVQLTSTPRTAA